MTKFKFAVEPRGIDMQSSAGQMDLGMSTVLPTASIPKWNLPRPKEQSTGLFFTPASPGPAFRFHRLHQ